MSVSDNIRFLRNRQDRQCKIAFAIWTQALGVNIVHGSHVSPVVLHPTEGGSTQFTGCVDSVDGLVLGQASLIPKLFPANRTRKYIFSLFNMANIRDLKDTLPEA